MAEFVVPKENTHIFLANQLLESITDPSARTMINANYISFCFGSIVADTFFYASSPDIVSISERLHGKEGEKTNELSFNLLDIARRDQSEKLLCLTLGHISHCVFDMVLHPVIYYLVGNYYDENHAKRNVAVYRHRLLETWLDNKLNNKYHLHKIFMTGEPDIHGSLEVIADCYGADRGELSKAFRKQVFGNRCFKSRLVYILVSLLHRVGVNDFSHILPLFYHHLETDPIEIQHTISFRDIIEGRERQESLTDLLSSAKEEALKRILAAISYYSGNMGRSEAMEIIRGESLDTGMECCGVDRIRHTK